MKRSCRYRAPATEYALLGVIVMFCVPALRGTAWCRGSHRQVPGVSYTAKKPSLAAPLVWRAAVEACLSASELAVHLRNFDAAVQWDAVRCAAGPAGEPSGSQCHLDMLQAGPFLGCCPIRKHVFVQPLCKPGVRSCLVGAVAATHAACSHRSKACQCPCSCRCACRVHGRPSPYTPSGGSFLG